MTYRMNIRLADQPSPTMHTTGYNPAYVTCHGDSGRSIFARRQKLQGAYTLRRLTKADVNSFPFRFIQDLSLSNEPFRRHP
jgi:hypothetical protein